MTKINQEDINKAVWNACDTFRGVVDAAQYKDYILTMMFIKYISDVWKAHYVEYKQQYGDDDARIRRKLERERFVLPMVDIKEIVKENGQDKEVVKETILADFYSLYDRRTEPNIGELINIVLDAIEENNKEKLEGVFRNIDFNSQTNLGEPKDKNRRLKLLLEDFNKPLLDMSPGKVSEDIIGNTYIYLIEKFASEAGKKAGEFYTPHMVSKLLAKLAKPKEGNKICDPACGSGGLLIEAAKEVGSSNYALFGMEVNGATMALARMNMFLHGRDSARIEWCNTLTSPKLVEDNKLMKFDVVVANPPFSLDKWGADEADADQYRRFHRGIPPKSKGDYAFISHMVESAQNKSGRVAVVVPHGVLFRGGSEGRIREQLIKENLLDAVIGLPANLFQTTSIPVAILVFDRSREKGGENEGKKDVLFIDASNEYSPGKNHNTLDEDTHVKRILETYDKRENVDKYAYVASYDEIKENDFNLNIPRYVDTFEEEEEIDIKAVQEDINRIEAELADVRSQMDKYLKELEHE